MKIIEKIKIKFRGTCDIDKLKKDGLIIGNNVNIQEGCIIDPGHCWLIEIGNNVTLAPRVHILAHDASTKKFIGYTRIGKVKIGNNVFIGAGTIILPGVEIGDNVVIGAGSIVTKNINSNSVVVGNPAKVISTTNEWLKKKKEELKCKKTYDETYTYSNITAAKKKEMSNDLLNDIGYII